MQKRLSDRVADDILTMIVIEKRFFPGEKLPNEIELSGELEMTKKNIRRSAGMETSYQVIDRKTWKRNMHCQIFQNSLEPQYCISLELDITNFLKMVKKNNYSFTFAFIYAVCKCANEIEEFRYRLLDDEVVLYDTIHTSFT